MVRLARVVAGLLLTSACMMIATAQAADKTDVTGGWNVEVDIGGNTGTPLFILKQEGEKLTGTYQGQFGEAELKGTVKGDEIEFAFEIQGNKIAYTGTIKKDSMEGKADYAGQGSGTWKGKKIDVSGTWDVEIELGGQSGSPVFTLKQEGEKLSGKYKGQFGDANLKGTVTGNKIQFTFPIEGGDVTYKGTIEKDTMKGEADYAGQASGTWSGKRKK